MRRSAAILILVLWGTAAVADQRDPRLAALFDRLRTSDDAREAAAVEQLIWEVWTASGDEELDALMARGVRAMNAGDPHAALAAFDALVHAAPDFAEAWNKRATVYWLIGSHAESLADIARTLSLEPRHFGALSGLALIHEANGRAFEAVEALERVRSIHPQLPHLGDRIQRLLDDFGHAV
jgi:tetratricopeptide (TPR) repeat protein